VTGQIVLTGYEGTRLLGCRLDLTGLWTIGQILRQPAKTDMTHRDQRVRLLRWISSMVRDDRCVMRTIEGERWGKKVLLSGMDWEWTEDLLEGQHESKVERLRRQGRASHD
jgi:hypothetical protein